ncbi:hypothetical protein Bbelb_037220 [Branchiostoma belcheri]|nr:hypothetical protein Bbelb_037220 [Branchiostoma belcheri]
MGQSTEEYWLKALGIRNEVFILRHLQNDNIMPIYGYVLAVPPVHYITEFMHYGNLQQHLRNNRRFMWPAQHLLSIATDILKALAFLESRSIVHRNVRAMKVLLGQSGSRMAIKLAGTREEELPLRWLAIESLAYCRYSVKSDIWMFAVLLYEIFTMGCVPWQEFAARPFDEVLQNIVHRNLRMKRPPCIPNAVFQVILKCMNVEDRCRPSYATLAEELGHLHDRYLETSAGASGSEERIYEETDVRNLSTAENIYEDVDAQDMMLVSSVAAADQPRRQEQNLFVEITSYGERKARTLKDLKREMKDQNATLTMIDLRQSKKEGSMTVVTEGTAMGTLEDQLIRKNDMDPTQYALPIAIALQAMHSKGFVHSDLRLGHVFIDATQHGTLDVQIKLGRLSRVKKLQLGVYDTDLSESMFQDTSGCPEDSIRWSPAEVIESGTYSFASDVYSLGVVFWQMYIACHVPLQGAHVRLIPHQRLEMKSLTTKLVLRFLEGSNVFHKPPGCPDWMYTVMKKCWAYQLLERPTVQDVIEVLNHSDHGRRLLETWSKTCDPPDLNGIYQIIEGNSMDSVLSDRTQMAQGPGTKYRNAEGQFPADAITELTMKLQVRTASRVTTPEPPLVPEAECDGDIHHYQSLKFDEEINEGRESSISDVETYEDWPTVPKTSIAGSTQVTVVRSYNPQDHLKLFVGDVLTHLEQLGITGSGWEVVVPSVTGGGGNPHLRARVIQDYTPEDELRIEAGELVVVEETPDAEAWVRVRSNRGVGYVPSACLARTYDAYPSLSECDIDSDTDRMMVSMADPGQLRVRYTKNGQVKTSMDQCLEADAALGMTEDDRDYYHPLAFGWTIMSMKKTQGDSGHIIYGPKIANGEEDGRLLLVCMSPSYGKKVVKHEWYKGGDLLCEGVDLCLLYATDPGEYRCHIISCQDDQEMAIALRVREDPIGEGACGTVFKAMLRRYTTVAAKKLQGCPLDNFGRNNEIDILRKLHHPNIVSFFGVCFRESLFIVTELVNGYDLRTAITEKMGFPPGCQGYIAYQLCQALDYVHHSMILHQDVKPSNVLVNAKTYVTKLSDFGLGTSRGQHVIVLNPSERLGGKDDLLQTLRKPTIATATAARVMSMDLVVFCMSFTQVKRCGKD